jgi:hypothetical protein
MPDSDNLIYVWTIYDSDTVNYWLVLGVCSLQTGCVAVQSGGWSVPCAYGFRLHLNLCTCTNTQAMSYYLQAKEELWPLHTLSIKQQCKSILHA